MAYGLPFSLTRKGTESENQRPETDFQIFDLVAQIEHLEQQGAARKEIIRRVVDGEMTLKRLRELASKFDY